MPGRRKNIAVDKIEGDSSSVGSPSLPEWFHRCKTHQIFQYDTDRFPFKELLADWLEAPCSDLERMHTFYQNSQVREPLHPQIRQAHISAKVEPALSSTMRRAKKKGLFSSPQYERLLNTYRLFVREVIAPLCYDNENETTAGGNHIVYQCPPTTRVVFPNGNRTIAMHSDSDYPGHQEAEINFWLPMTNVCGNNSLWVESEPQKGDFKPIEMKYGQFLRFDGFSCRHYTVHNDTPSCRVSFDFRVIPSSLCAKRSTLGDFCIEETTHDGFAAYWSNSKKQKSPVPSSEGVNTSLSSLMTSLSLEPSKIL
jgi:hypothetical protein